MLSSEYVLQRYLKILKVYYNAKFLKFVVISFTLLDGVNFMRYVTLGELSG